MSVHGHEIMRFLADYPEGCSILQLQQFSQQFGADPRFHTCSAQDMNLQALIDFLQVRGKVLVDGDKVTLLQQSCDHE